MNQSKIKVGQCLFWLYTPISLVYVSVFPDNHLIGLQPWCGHIHYTDEFLYLIICNSSHSKSFRICFSFADCVFLIILCSNSFSSTFFKNNISIMHDSSIIHKYKCRIWAEFITMFTFYTRLLTSFWDIYFPTKSLQHLWSLAIVVIKN